MIRLQHPRLGRISVRSNIIADGDAMTGVQTLQVSDMARIRAFRVEAGLFYEPEPSLWRRLMKAVGHGIGLPEQAPGRGAGLIL